MRVAVIQFNATSDKANNLRRACSYVVKASEAGARFVLLPEVFTSRGPATKSQNLHKIADRVPGETTQQLSRLAQKNKIYLLAGSLYEKIPANNKIYNTSILFNLRGEIQAAYRKMHLFNAVLGQRKIKENDYFAAGKKPVIAEIDGWRVGLSICYDLRFPELYRFYSRQGVHIIVVPSAFTQKTGQAHWEILLRARAIENLCYVLAPDQVGEDGRGVASYGHSMIIGPWGDILRKGSAAKEEIIFADLDKKIIEKSRKTLPATRPAHLFR